MSNVKHTRGPWEVKHSQSNPAFNVVGTRLGERYKIARCLYVVSPVHDDEFLAKESKEAEANAKLISVAPDLLEALEECVELMKINAGERLMMPAIKRAEMIINKALR